MGSSTADVVATIRAVCDCCGLPLDDLHVSAIAVQAETASDPLAFDTTPVLFAQRHAEVLRTAFTSLGPWAGCVHAKDVVPWAEALDGRGVVDYALVGRLWRDAKLYEIGAGTSEIRRMLIGRELFVETR